MADIAHLEKMGRELKCPICLSLLNSAVSLTCNHVFCNLCILKSMKSGSNCPVCKVPFQRREVRPAPHMDNLVNIYKGMEVASGINIFTTQIAPATNISDGQNQGKDKSDLDNPDIGGNSCRKNKNERKFKGKNIEHVKTNEKIPSPHLVKPSFPAKKRVHVPHYPLSETPTRPKRSDAGFGKSVEQELLDSSVLPNKKPIITEAGEPILSPFFWLRERNPEDDDDTDKFCSQHTEGDIVTDTPQKAPSFSDLKDSDDETPTTMTVNEEVHNGFKAVDAFDSEMFEWTQRACSPELFSTPIKKQEVNKDELCVIQEESDATLHACTTSPHGGGTISEKLRSISAKQGAENRNADLSNPVPSTNKSVKVPKEKKKSNKRAKRTNGRSQRKRLKLSLDGGHGEVPIDSSEIENLNEGNRCNINDDALNLVGRNIRRGKKTSSIATVLGKAQNVPTESIEANIPKIRNQGGDNVGSEFAVSSGEGPRNDENLTLRCKAGKGSEIADAHPKKHPKRTKSQRVDDAIAKVLNEIPMNANQEYENMHVQLPLSSCLKANNSETLNLGEKSDTMAKLRAKRRKKRLNNSTDAKSKDGSVDEVLDDSNKDATKKTESIEHLKENLKVAHRKSETNDKVLAVANGGFLRKCETAPNQIQCAFCKSSQDSEASGEMMHYFRGKPVALDYYDEGSNVIHSHKNCTEWAPNVYFENDTAVNLETELARSRRIKCSCCGIKGAALGCYEKSCRKSFHVPCAKLVPQCRWDGENFVILCPLHTSSKLPCETSGPQEKSRKRPIPKGESHASKIKAPVKHDLTVSQQWKHSGSFNKWVFCCSSLAAAEKETVSKFAKLAGISVAKTWCSSITHVIASTDENGACRRTLKFLMGVLEGKWIMKIDWIKACMDALGPVSEVQYEIREDIHGIRDGPGLGRLRVLNKQPKLFNGFTFYLMGEFTPSYKGYLQDLIFAAGGTVLQRKPISKDQGVLLSESSKSIFIIYSLELLGKSDPVNKTTEICNRRRADAEALANSAGAKVASNSWVLDSIAACKLQSLA
ncbi:protein BREAST CANCER SUSCEPTIBILITY 1 homolog [Telopea speciosissima]|uniref:protein BREAST CANCER SUSCEPTIBILITY 1 homolog n=1 Tax=Telopea speciosissima TaxID=54955 RepID=UPI001CC8126F|nr:protein BREAST CANCER SUSCEPTIBILITY 1 homolog [Telopea speciosissima]